MAVALPSDLIVDVMQNADPSRLKEAKARLHDVGSIGSSDVFQSVLVSLGEKQAVHVSPALPPELQLGGSLLSARSGKMNEAAETDVHVAFERMVLRNLLETLLPEAGTGAYGTGPSAGIWRSLAADQLAGLYAGAGGVGIAATLSLAADQSSTDHGPQWPYFTTDDIKAFTG